MSSEKNELCCRHHHYQSFAGHGWHSVGGCLESVKDELWDEYGGVFLTMMCGAVMLGPIGPLLWCAKHE